MFIVEMLSGSKFQPSALNVEALFYSYPTVTATVLICAATFRERKKHMNINSFAGLSRDWVGGKIFFMCFWVIPYGGEKHINKIPTRIPGQSCENSVYEFFSSFVFRPQYMFLI